MVERRGKRQTKGLNEADHKSGPGQVKGQRARTGASVPDTESSDADTVRMPDLAAYPAIDECSPNLRDSRQSSELPLLPLHNLLSNGSAVLQTCRGLHVAPAQ